MNQESISVIIVTYNNGHQIRACLSSLRQKPKPQQIFLIDNHSRDQTREQTQRFIRDNPTFPIQATWNNQNLGFAHGLNQGLKNAKSKFILLLTPDAELLPGALQQLMDHMQINSDVAMTAPQLLTPSGAIQPSCRRFPTYKDLIFELTGLPRLLKIKSL